MQRTLIKTAPWIFGLLTLCVAFCAFGVAVLSGSARDWMFWGTVILLVLFAIALLAAASSRIEDDGDAIRVVAGFRAKRITKTAIAGVSWEKGGRAFLTLHDATVVKLPMTGRNGQGVVNTVRSWLPRTV